MIKLVLMAVVIAVLTIASLLIYASLLGRIKKYKGRYYLVIAKLKLKDRFNWTPVIIYMCLYINRDGMFWIRHEKQFNEKFK